jgi:CTP synthase (UTP-ammonia lyase)
VADPLQIGILGDYDPASSTLPAVEQSIKHAAEKLKVTAQAQWLATDSLLDADLENKLEAFDGLWAGPGSPYKSLDECYAELSLPAAATGRLWGHEGAFNTLW